MKKILTLLFFFVITNSYGQETENIIKLHTILTPNAGSFVATSNKARGRLLKTNNVFTADRLSVFSDSFQTENTLRDQHVADYIAGGDKRPHNRIDIINLKGENNQAKATIVINGIQKEVSISYEIKETFVNAQFEINTADFNLAPASFLGVKVSPNVKITAKYYWESK